ncbi:MAG: hypothetical protein V3W34_12245 [Phycisphaerae bacterium]
MSEPCNLDGWNADILTTWATYSIERGAFEDDDNCVIFARGGINNGGGGNQALYRTDWFGDHSRVQARVKISGLESQGINIGGGLLGRYTPLEGGHPGCPLDCPPYACSGPDLPSGGTGYAAYIHINTQGPETVQLVRIDGTFAPQPNYCYATDQLLLGDATLTLDSETWYFFELEMIGDTIRVKLDNAVILEAQDGTYSSGLAGLYYHGSRPGNNNQPPEVWYDDVGFEGS